jgi:methylated-DNA-protein-cysteine methyltransferase related protein
MISSRGPGSVDRHAAALRREGVRVERGSMGEMTIEFGKYGWFPTMLPSEEGKSDESDSGEHAEG